LLKFTERLETREMTFSTKVSRQLVNTYDLIAYEDLRIKNMMQYGNLAKAVGDCSWGTFLQYIQYKADNAGKYAMAVDPRGTSQRCNLCGTRNTISLSVREFECVGCHNVLHRDKNASTNVLTLGLSAVFPMDTEAPDFRQGV
jgi:putative transposase